VTGGDPRYSDGVRRVGLAIVLAACALAGALAAVVVAGPTAASVLTTGTTGTTPTGTEPLPPPPPPAPRVIAAGVTVGGVHVGGMPAEAALSVVRTAFFAPLVITFHRHVFRPTPGRLGATAAIPSAVNRALVARPGTRVPLRVRVRTAAVRRYVGVLGKRFDRPPVDARYVLRGRRPVVVRDRPGRRLQRPAAMRAIVAALRANERLPMRLRAKRVPARVTRRTLGQAIVIQRGSNRLSFYERGRLVRTFGVATGESRYPTPLGRFSIVVKWRNPWWYPPNSDWARGASPIPPGPGNPLGTRWMGLSASGVGIHGTPDAASIGYSVSHGCIRMRIAEAEWLFERVAIGTPVFIVSA
jgi:lipoprotein-anchoring transpeptidase ErfK/SrfK